MSMSNGISASPLSSSIDPANNMTLKDNNINYHNNDFSNISHKVINEKKALIVSVSSYEKLRNLDFCKKDGEEIYSILKNLGYQISSDNTLIGGQVKYEILRKSLIKFFTNSDIRSKDTLLFYFSGHGIPDGEGDTYIAVSDTDPDKPYENGISFEDLTKWMNKSISKRVVMILDCCCSGAAKITKGSEDEAAYLTRSAIDEKSKKLRQGEGKYLLAASLAAQAAYNMKKEDHSLFTYYLIDGLKGANGETVDKDGYVTPETLGSYVYDKVTSSLPKQKPVIKVEASGKIILASYPELSKSSINTFKDYATNDATFDKIQKYIEKGKEYREIGSYTEAIHLLDEILKLDSHNFTACRIKAEILSDDLGEYEEAIPYFERILDKSPSAVKVLKGMAFSLEKLSRYEEAIECYDKVLEKHPNDEDSKKKRDIALEKHKEQKFSLIIKEIKNEFKKNEYSKVIDLCDTAIDIQPKDIIPYLYKGLSLSNLKRNDEAILSFDKILEIEPDNIQAFKEKGIILEKMGKFEQSLQCYEKVLQKKPNEIQCLDNKGNSLYMLKRYEDAITCYDKVLDIDKNNLQALNGKARAFYSLEKFEDAIKFYDQVLKINPNDEDAKKTKEKAVDNINKKRYASIIEKVKTGIEEKKDYSTIVSLCDNAIKSDPTNHIVYIYKGLALTRLKKYGDAIQSYNKVLEIEPQNVEALYEKGKIFYKLKKYEDAIKWYDKALQIEPNNTNVKQNREIALKSLKTQNFLELIDVIKTQYTKKNYSDVINLSNKAIKINPKNHLSYLYKGYTLQELTRYEEALQCYDKILKIKPKHADVSKKRKIIQKKLDKKFEGEKQRLNDKGFALHNQGKYQEAIEYYDKALRIYPKFKNALNGKGLSLDCLGKYQEAIEWYDKALAIDPNYDYALNNKGATLYNQGKYQEAIEYYDKALRVNPNFTLVQDNKKLALERLSKEQNSKKKFFRWGR